MLSRSLKICFYGLLILSTVGISWADDEIVYQDDGKTWHINTFPPSQHNEQNYLHVYTWEPEGDLTLIWAGGYADSNRCVENIEDLNLKARLSAIDWCLAARKVTNKERIVAMSVSVCHPDWVCIYVEGDNNRCVFDDIVAEHNK